MVVGSFHTHGKGGGSRCLDNRLIRVRHLAAHTSHTTSTANTTRISLMLRQDTIVSGCATLRLISATGMRGERLETDTSPPTPYVNTASKKARSRLPRRSTTSCHLSMVAHTTRPTCRLCVNRVTHVKQHAMGIAGASKSTDTDKQ